jgi:ubiquinone/menaquinone biosynthesis C-methylase UbiE
MSGKKNYETWWENNLGSDKYFHNGQWYNAPTVSTFESWMGDHNSPDRVYARTLFVPYDSVLDAGCGAAPEAQTIDTNKYTGMDITQKLVDYNNSRGIKCVQGTLENIPFNNSQFDIVISRHVTEHTSSIEKPLNELIRVAKKQVIVSFFIKPEVLETHKIFLDNVNTEWEIYHNVYSKTLIEQQLANNKKVDSYSWIEGCASTQCYLDIKLITTQDAV